jgi:hypothetical protein
MPNPTHVTCSTQNANIDEGQRYRLASHRTLHFAPLHHKPRSDIWGNKPDRHTEAGIKQRERLGFCLKFRYIPHHTIIRRHCIRSMILIQSLLSPPRCVASSLHQKGWILFVVVVFVFGHLRDQQGRMRSMFPLITTLHGWLQRCAALPSGPSVSTTTKL